MLYQKFMHAVAWNTINIFLYKILLQTHQAFLFCVISRELFGLSGVIFSALYFIMSLTNFGFDYKIVSNYQYYCLNKEHFKSLIVSLVLRALGVCVMAPVGFVLLVILQIGAMAPGATVWDGFDQIPFIVTACLALIFVTESMKKSLELIAQLSFLNKSITLIEICTLLSYFSLVWYWYFMTGSISLATIFVPMALTSFVELLLLIDCVHSFYQTLPDKLDSQADVDHVPACSTATSYLNQLCKTLFSPNFLILLLAFKFGLKATGYIKLFTDIIILLYMLLNKSIGIPSAALLSYVSQPEALRSQTLQSQIPQPQRLENLRTAFLKITNAYIQLLYALAGALLLFVLPCLIKHACLQPVVTLTILFFILAGFIEYLLITYEKLFLTQGASLLLARINAISALCWILFLYQGASRVPDAYLLLPLVAIRMMTVAVVALIAQRTWLIAPSFKMHPRTLAVNFILIAAALLWHLKR